MPAKASCFLAVHPPRSSGQILLPHCLMNSSCNLDETYREYSLAPSDDLIRFWRSKVKITASRWGGECIHVNARASKSAFYFIHENYDLKVKNVLHCWVCHVICILCIYCLTTQCLWPLCSNSSNEFVSKIKIQ